MNEQLKSTNDASLVLCVVDFSEASNRALRWAVKMARCLNAHITILHTFRLLQSKNGEVLSLKRKKEEEAANQFKAIEKDVLVPEKISYDFRTEVGFFTDRVEDYASRNSIELLVIDKTMIDKNMETFEELIKNLQIPLVVIP
jgi:hypothetical protein